MFKKNSPILIVDFISAALTLAGPIFAQKVVAEVKIILKKLPLEKREKLADFEQKLTDYINEMDWCEDRYGTELHVKIQIFLSDASVSYEDRYRGTLLISNNSDMQFYDKRWLFSYNSLEPLIKDESQFHPLTSVLDFYVNILLGGEFDKFGKLEGSPYYKKADNISQQARFSKYINGWDERKIVIDRILARENEPYRLALDSYFLGISYSSEDIGATRKYCKKAIDLLANLILTNHEFKLPAQFIDGHRTDIINIFKDDENYQDVFDTLIKIDPDHKDAYENR